MFPVLPKWTTPEASRQLEITLLAASGLPIDQFDTRATPQGILNLLVLGRTGRQFGFAEPTRLKTMNR